MTLALAGCAGGPVSDFPGESRPGDSEAPLDAGTSSGGSNPPGDSSGQGNNGPSVGDAGVVQPDADADAGVSDGGATDAATEDASVSDASQTSAVGDAAD